MSMNIAIIGRSNTLLQSAELLVREGFNIKLVVTNKEADEYTVGVKDFKEFAFRNNAHFIAHPKVSVCEIEELFEDVEINLDLGISMNYSGVISEDICSMFRVGILNAHGGDLPKYRGNACQAWAIINGEDYIGLCIHKMIGGELDSGNIVARQYFSIGVNTRIGEVYNWFEQIIPDLFLASAQKLLENEEYVLEIQSKNIEDSLRCYPRKPEDGRIHWRSSSKNVLRLINASSEPYSGAFCRLNLDKLIIWRAELEEFKQPFLALPGQVMQRNSDGSVIVACSNGVLKVTEVEIEGVRTKPTSIITSLRTRLS